MMKFIDGIKKESSCSKEIFDEKNKIRTFAIV
jgi:hypothetical protein